MGEHDMADSRSERVLWHLHQGVGTAATSADDGQLLERFVRQHDEQAFAELVARHGPLVLGLCRRLLGNVQNAEDVFQAAFFVLARKAGTIHKPESLSCWLHGVAYRLARQVRAEGERRRLHERKFIPVSEIEDVDLSWREVRSLLDEELQQLPEKLRSPLVLCYLEGLTQDEASRRLGWSRSTLKRRLETGRERLRDRLTRRGVTLGAGLFAAALTESAAKGAVSRALRGATVRASMEFLTHETPAVAATPAALLAKGALQSMLTSKLKLGAILILLFGCAVTAAGLALPQAATEKSSEKKGQTAVPSHPVEKKHVRKDRYGDALPERALARLGTLRLRHTSGTGEAVFTQDGKTVIVSDWGGEVIFWEVATGREVRRLQAAGGPDNGLALAISGDGKMLVTGGFGRYSLWDTATGKKLFQDQLPIENIWQLIVTPDGKTMVCHDAKTILLWDIPGNKKRHELKGYQGHVLRLALSPDGKTLASVSWKDRHIRLWDIDSGKEQPRIAAHESDGIYVAFSPDGKMLASAGSPYSGLCLWDAATGKKIRQLPLSPFLFAFFPGGKTMAGLEPDGPLHVYDVVRGKHLRQYDTPSGHFGLSSADDQMMTRLAISPDGKTVATLGAGANSFDLGDASRGKLMHSFAGHRSGVANLAFTADGKTIFSSAFNEPVLAWDTATGELGRQFDNRRGPALALSPDGNLLASIGLRAFGGAGMILWDTASYKEVRALKGPFEHIKSAAWSDDGKTLVTSSQDGTIRIWSAATGKQLRVIDTKRHARSEIAVSPDGAIVAASEYGRDTISLWAADTGKKLRSIATAQSVVSALAFSPDGSILVSGGWVGGICLSETATGRVLHRWDTTPARTGCVVFSRDGRTLVSGHSDSSVRLWEVATGKERACFRGHRGAVQSAAISRDGRQVVSGSADTTILIWDPSGGTRPDAALSAEEWLTLWRDLIDDDAGRAYRALWQVALSPKQALPFLTERLHPVAPLDAARQKQANRLLADLESGQLAIRQRAETELEKMGPLVEPALRKALENKPSLEVRQRVEKVLETLASERLRITRALEAIEHMNTHEARRLVESLANGLPQDWLTEEARAVRKRLANPTATAPAR
jgi:RNA polymerase sigma factor (sigma-70 family)